jgi:hypothetical protein
LTPKYKNTLEWELGCINTNNIAFKPHGALLTGQRERYTVVYPFANMIIDGHLAKLKSFKKFRKSKVLVLCNMRFEKKLRPDLLAISAEAEILIIEAKLRRENGEAKALQRLTNGSKELSDYADRLKRFAAANVDNAYAAWTDRYYNSFTKGFGFPSFYQSISSCMSLNSYDAQKYLINKLNNNILEGKVNYGLAFNGPNDQQEKGVDLPGYVVFSKIEIMEAAEKGWRKDFGELFLFMIDHRKEQFKLI